MNAIVPSVPRQSGEVKISKLGMFLPVPPSQRRCSPIVTRRSMPSPSTCEPLDLQRVEAPLDPVDLAEGLAPAPDRVGVVEEAAPAISSQ